MKCPGILFIIIITVLSPSPSYAVELTGEFRLTSRQSTDANLCPAHLTVQRISNTAMEVYGAISSAAYGYRPFGDDGDYIFTNINRGIRVEPNPSRLIQTETVMTNNAIVFNRKVINPITGRISSETTTGWYFLNSSTADLMAKSLFDEKAAVNLPSSKTVICTYERQTKKQTTSSRIAKILMKDLFGN